MKHLHRITEGEQRLLDAVAAAGYKPGDQVAATWFSEATKLSHDRCSKLAYRLKQKKLWPYQSKYVLGEAARNAQQIRAEKHDNACETKHEEYKARALLIRKTMLALGRQLTLKELDKLFESDRKETTNVLVT